MHLTQRKAYQFHPFEVVLECLRRMETTLISLKEMRGFVGRGIGNEMLEVLIEETELQIAELKRRVVN